MERAEVQFGKTTIPFVIRRTGRVKTVSIAIDPRLGVVVTAPSATPRERLEQLVHKKAPWITGHLRQMEDVLPALSKREFVSAESFLYLGRQYRLRVTPGTEGPVRLERGWFVVPVPARHDAGAVRAAMTEWFQAHARERIAERLPVWAKKVGVEVPRLLIREPRQRWASCDAKGVLRVNWRIVQAPARLVDYILAHELVHLRHRSHSREFWTLLGKVMPDYEERREALRAQGPRLIW